MLSQPPVWFILLAFIAALGPLVFFHELGHYLVARWFGVGAESFSIGFGREVAGWTDKRGTRWKVGWLPLGGYVKFIGDLNPVSMPADMDDVPAEDRSRAFHHRPVWQRFLIVLAGPLANFILAILIFTAFFGALGVPRTANVVTAVQAGGSAQSAGIRTGDRIISIAGRATPSFEDISQIVILRPGARVDLQLERGGRQVVVPVLIGSAEETDRFGQSMKVGRLGIYGQQRQYVRMPAVDLVPTAASFTWSMTRSIVDALGQIVTGKRSAKELGGPLRMAQIAGQQASLGLFEFVYLIALFSINLGFINLLPVPMLDGGHLALYTVEAVQRRPVSLQAQEWAFRGGLAFLLALLLFTTFNDLGSFGLWASVGRLIG
jgi:regulator of sigma E protease